MDLREVDLLEPLGDLDLEQLVVNTILEPGPHLLRLLDVVENPTHHKRIITPSLFFQFHFLLKQIRGRIYKD